MLSRSVICCVLLVLLVSLQAAAEGGKRSKGHDRHYRSTDCSSSEDCLYSSDDTTFGHYDYHDFLRGHRRGGRSVRTKKRVGTLVLEEADDRVLDHHVLEDIRLAE